MTNLLADKQKLTAAVGGLTVLALGIYTSKEGTRVAGRAIDRYDTSPPEGPVKESADPRKC